MTSLDAHTEVALERPASVLCAHCQTPVPETLIDEASSNQFCCGGCRSVFDVIRACGLDGFYGLIDPASGSLAPAQPTGGKFEEFDDPTFMALHGRNIAGGACDIELYLEGVHCAACVWLIEKLPRLAPGVLEARLEFRRSIVRIVWDPSRVRLSRIAQRLDSLGYPAHPFKGRELRDLRRNENRAYLIRIAIAGAVAGNVMLIAFALYGGMFHGIEAEYLALFRWTSLALTFVALLWPGRVFFEGAIAALRAHSMHMDVPIATGLAAGAAWSAFNTIRGTGEVYFDSIAVLVFLLLVGRWIQLAQQRAGQNAMELMFSLTPRKARLVENDITRDVPLEALVTGQRVEVLAGESVPVDGVVVEGESDLDLSLLTGESKPVSAGAGDDVFAGTTNRGSRLLVQITATGEQTRMGQLMHLVEDSSRRRAPIVQLADRIAGVFVIVVLLLAAATAFLWWSVSQERAIANAVSLLIITCPCALGLATPLALVASIGRAANRGILIKGGEVIERLNHTGTICLDKTGTLTEGRLAVVEWFGPDECKSIAAALEAQSVHPTARAFVETFTPCEASSFSVREVRAHQSGIVGVVNDRRVAIGSRRFVEDAGLDIPISIHTFAQQCVAKTLSPVFLAMEGSVVACAGLGDPIESDAAASISELRELGWSVQILSGDHQRIVESVGEALDIPLEACHGELTPADKLDLVTTAAANGPVVMVGDGVNDAAALAAASVGVAMRGGAEVSLSVADVYLAEGGLAPLVDLLRGSRRTFGVIKRNIAVSFLYNAIGISLAAAGLINPLIAAVLMPISSLSVITMSYRSCTFDRQGGAICR